MRFIPKWDGETSDIVPLLVDNQPDNYYIHSAFDLAYLQGRSAKKVLLMTDVDLGGDRNSKKNVFKSISSITELLDGGIYDEQGKNIGKNSIYNLYIEDPNPIAYNGFIREASSGTHKNLTFVNSSVIVHFTQNQAKTEDIGYAGTLTPFVNGASGYVVDNVDVENGYVFGLGKIGGLIGFVSGDTSSFECKNCDITGTTVKNEKGETAEKFEREVSIFTITATVSTSFFAHGEAGGMIGMIMGNSAISNCHVTNSIMDCYGEEDKDVPVKLGGWLETVINVHIEGRHVNNFIGNIRTISGQKITIKDCSATGRYVTTDGKRMDDPFTKGNNATNLVGKPYYLHYGPIEFDTKGSVIIGGIEFL